MFFEDLQFKKNNGFFVNYTRENQWNAQKSETLITQI